jgi:hypothetical protein
METSDTCIITEDHVCAENKNSISSDLSQGIVHLEEVVPSENNLQKKNSGESDRFLRYIWHTSMENVYVLFLSDQTAVSVACHPKHFVQQQQRCTFHHK